MSDAIRFFDELHGVLSHDDFQFMNHGYAETEDEFAWLDPRLHFSRYSLNLVRKLIDGVHLAGRDILDVGCGRGGACRLLAELSRTGKVVGVDLSQENVAFAQRTRPEGGATFLWGSAENLPVADASFDVVTNIESSHCYGDQPRFAREVARVLRPKGMFCYTDCMPSAEFSRRPSLFLNSGFRLLDERDVTAQVSLALERHREELQVFLARAISGGPRSVGKVGSLMASISIFPQANYDGGVVKYGIWRFQKC